MPQNSIIISWCPGSKCDPCPCGWAQAIQNFYITDPTKGVVGSIDQAKTFCGAPYWGLGCVSANPAAKPGDVVDGYIDIFCSGTMAVGNGADFTFIDLSPGVHPGAGWTVMPIYMNPPGGYKPALPVLFQGSEVFSIDPSTGSNPHPTPIAVGENIGVDGQGYDVGRYGAAIRVPFSGCIMLGPKDRIRGIFNCVHPYTGPIPPDVVSLRFAYGGDPTYAAIGIIAKTAPSVFVQHSSNGGEIDFSSFPPGWTWSMAPPYPNKYKFYPWNGDTRNDMYNSWACDLSVLATPPFYQHGKILLG